MRAGVSADSFFQVPKPKPSVFQTTKMLHNILQGANEDGDSIGENDYQAITDWISENAGRYWFSDQGPLCSLGKGGVDIVVVDDPQMAELVAMSKDVAPNRPVFYRSHIQIRSDLVSRGDSPQAQAWSVLWKRIKGCDKFLSHPVDSFVPDDVPKEKIIYFPGTSDLLDGLNKSLNDWDWKYYGHLYNVQCLDKHKTQLDWENRPYIIQISRFDPSKAIDTVIDSYGEFRKRCTEAGMETSRTPQLVICGNGSSDDPDAARISSQAERQIKEKYQSLADDISVMSLDPNDQLLNALLSRAKIVLQLSTGEGYEVKVSEAQRKGRPVIGTRVGGIPLQVTHNETGFLVEAGDYKDVAGRMMDLCTDDGLWKRTSDAAVKKSNSDETTAVGNALMWLKLALEHCD
jgi:alpha,alpha-trehalose phosphorylase (configuration-retaining)